MVSVALVLGGSDRLWQDVEAALGLVPPNKRGIVACNDAIVQWDEHLDAAVSVHAEKIGQWIESRRAKALPEPVRVLTMRDKRAPCWAEQVPHHFDGQTSRGSSGLFGVKVALVDLAFDAVILCGVGMEQTPHFVRGGEWRSALRYQRGWLEALPMLRDRVRSMSGWTRKQLGAPTPEWVNHSVVANGSPAPDNPLVDAALPTVG